MRFQREGTQQAISDIINPIISYAKQRSNRGRLLTASAGYTDGAAGWPRQSLAPSLFNVLHRLIIMRMVGLIRSKEKADWVVCGVRLGLRASSLAMAINTVAAFRKDQTGEGLVYLGFALAHVLFASTDLRKIWDCRHMNIGCAARASPASFQSAIGTWMAYVLIISGVILQHVV